MKGKRNDKVTSAEPTDLLDLGAALDEDGYERLQQQHPLVAEGVMEAVRAGAREGAIYEYVLRHTNNREMAKWCGQAARHLEHQRGD